MKTGQELWKYNCGAGVNAPAFYNRDASVVKMIPLGSRYAEIRVPSGADGSRSVSVIVVTSSSSENREQGIENKGMAGRLFFVLCSLFSGK